MSKLSKVLLALLSVYYVAGLIVGLYLFFVGGKSPLDSLSHTEILALEFIPLLLVILIDVLGNAAVTRWTRIKSMEKRR